MLLMAGLALVMSVPMIDSGSAAASPNPPAPAPAGQPAAVTSGPTPYAVRSGDSLAGIAHRYGIGLSSLLRANTMTVATLIHPGDVITLPAGARVTPLSTSATSSSGSRATSGTTPAETSPATATADSTTYVVKPGDALAGIAWRHGVKLGAFVKANNLTTTSTIYPGQTLTVPPATMPVPASVTPASTTAASPAAPAVPNPSGTSAAAPSTSVDTILTFLRSQVGKPYKFFSAGPDTYDCSGLVVAGWKQVGVALPHQSQALAAKGTAVDWLAAPIQPGDLVFTSAYDDAARITHVGVALSDSSWIHAVGVGRTVSIHAMPSDTRIVAVRRLG
jgi:cell wall-associated NlpC family hydrolase